MRFRILIDGEAHEVGIEGTPPSMHVSIDGAVYRARVAESAHGLVVRVGSGRHRVEIRGKDVTVDGRRYEVAAELAESSPEGAVGRGRSGPGTVIEIRPPMPGRVVKVRVAPGEHVKRGQTLAVLEAMKMQNEIPAPEDAVVRSVSVREGESIPGDRVIAVLEVLGPSGP